jgi:predicted small secreted protein
MRKTKAIIAMFLATTLLAACNTVEGAGKDIKSAGDTIEDAAD